VDVTDPGAPHVTRVDLPGDRGLGGLHTDGALVLRATRSAWPARPDGYASTRIASTCRIRAHRWWWPA
jgi:hypothetical protein